MDTPAIRFFRQFPETVAAMEAIVRKPKGDVLPPQRIQNFLDATPLISDITNAICRLNLFEALGVGENEIRHSRLLAWLLTPNDSHGEGSIFLQRFLQTVLEDDGKSLRDFGNLDFSAFEVETEAEYDDKKIDVLLINRTAKFVCVIENKIHAEQGKGQLEGYRKRIATRFPDYEKRFVFLTLANEKPADSEWIGCRYGTVLRSILGKDKRPTTRTDVLGLLFKNYVDWVRSGGEPDRTNFFTILNLNRHELRHSDFLAWLLDPRGSHGLGEQFLRYLMRRSGLGGLLDNSTTLDWSDVEVLREFENIDVLVFSERNRVAIILENKVRAKEREGQLGDYREFVRRHFLHDHLVSVFLDMQGRSSSEACAVNLSYTEILPFFEDHIKSLEPISADPVTVLIKEYRTFLETKLWTREGIEPPPRISEMVNEILRTCRREFECLLVEIKAWKESLASELGDWLLREAQELFGSKYSVCFKRDYFSFTPHEYDTIPSLRTGGGNRAWQFDNRLLIYQFFVIPFGSARSIRPPQLSLDTKLLAPNPTGEALHTYLHNEAKKFAPFNRAKGKTGKHTGLLSHRLISNADVARLSRDELRRKLRQQLERFQHSIHPELVGFFRKKVADFELSRR